MVESNIMPKKAKKLFFSDKISINTNKNCAFAKQKINKLSLKSQSEISKVDSCKI